MIFLYFSRYIIDIIRYICKANSYIFSYSQQNLILGLCVLFLSNLISIGKPIDMHSLLIYPSIREKGS